MNKLFQRKHGLPLLTILILQLGKKRKGSRKENKADAEKLLSEKLPSEKKSRMEVPPSVIVTKDSDNEESASGSHEHSDNQSEMESCHSNQSHHNEYEDEAVEEMNHNDEEEVCDSTVFSTMYQVILKNYLQF